MVIGRQSKELLLGQRAKVIWFTGLPCSGKTTLALALEKALFEAGFHCQVLDGDNVRCGINSNLGFSPADRLENIRRIAEVSRLFLSAGVITINAFVSPTEEIRQLALQIIGPDDFVEVYLDTDLAVCESRDVKGMYLKARQGLIKDFTGVDAPFEPPLHPALVLQTGMESLQKSTDTLVNFILPLVKPES